MPDPLLPVQLPPVAHPRKWLLMAQVINAPATRMGEPVDEGHLRSEPTDSRSHIVFLPEMAKK